MNPFLGLVYVKLCGLPNHNPKKIAILAITILITMIGYAASVLSLLEIIGVIDLN